MGGAAHRFLTLACWRYLEDLGAAYANTETGNDVLRFLAAEEAKALIDQGEDGTDRPVANP